MCKEVRDLVDFINLPYFLFLKKWLQSNFLALGLQGRHNFNKGNAMRGVSPRLKINRVPESLKD